jgi:hypothetical protein
MTAYYKHAAKLVKCHVLLYVPFGLIKRKSDMEAQKDITKQNTRVLVGFRNAYVFDVEQTEGVELPAMREVDGDVGENHDRLLSFIDRQGIELVFTEKITRARHVLQRTHCRFEEGYGYLRRWHSTPARQFLSQSLRLGFQQCP